MGPSQNYRKTHADLTAFKRQSGHHVPRHGRNQATMCQHMGPTLSPLTPSPTLGQLETSPSPLPPARPRIPKGYWLELIFIVFYLFL